MKRPCLKSFSRVSVLSQSWSKFEFKLFDKLQKTNPALADQLLEEVQLCEDNARLVGRKAEFTSDRERERAENILEIFRTWSRNDLSAFKSLVKNDEDFKDCVITKKKK